MNKLFFVLLTGFLFISTGIKAEAFDVKNLYLGGGGSFTYFEGEEHKANAPNGWHNDLIEDTEFGGKVFLGYRLHKYIAVEGGFHYFGEATDMEDNGRNLPDRFKGRGLSLSVLAILPVRENIEIFAKVGGIYGWLKETDYDAFPDGVTEDGLAAILGAGVDLNVTENIVLRTEFEYIPSFADGEDDTGDETASVDLASTSMSLI